MFELDVQFDVRIHSEPTGPPVTAASVGASQLPEAGQEGANVQKNPNLDKKIREMTTEYLAADDNGVYYNVSDGKKGVKSAKHGALQGEQTQDTDTWNKC